MNADALKKMYGDDYPAAVVVDGIRLPLRRERRFSRSYYSDKDKLGSEVSRFMDGSVSITAAQLQCEWPRWTESERMDFCQSCGWLDKQPDFPDMLRFIMEHAAPSEWSGVAMSVAAHLPPEEAFEILRRALSSVEIGKSANIGQAIGMTKHPEAEPTLRRHLAAIWAHTALWENAELINWVAFDATTCIAHLIELGAAREDFEERVLQLANHNCPGNRDSCRSFLSKHYPWLTL